MTKYSSNQSTRRIALAGASGTIGRAVAVALIADGYEVTCLLRRSRSGKDAAASRDLAGAHIRFVDFGIDADVAYAIDETAPDCVITCLASRTGDAKSAQAIDHDANLALLNAAERSGAEQFILLSAICVQRPQLAFQHAKLAFEARLIESKIAHTIIRPTAFFKSLSGQIDRVINGKSFLLFGDGELTRCKPISDRDLARFIVSSIGHCERLNQILPVGGPGPAISLREQGAILFAVAGKRPRFTSVPVGMFNAIIGILSLAERWSDGLAQKCEYARIGRYYATQSMLVLDPETDDYSADMTPEFGSDTLRAHYEAEMEHRRSKEGAAS